MPSMIKAMLLTHTTVNRVTKANVNKNRHFMYKNFIYTGSDEKFLGPCVTVNRAKAFVSCNSNFINFFDTLDLKLIQ